VRIDSALPPQLQMPEMPSSAKQGGKSTGFSDTLNSAIQNVEQSSAEADAKVKQLLNGGEDVHSAMIAVEQANLSFELMMQVRNKIVSAYQEVARLQF